jgi:transposase
MSWTVAIGVDTHRDTHTAVGCDRFGVVVAELRLPASAAGYRELYEWARRLGEPAFAIEGTGSYGAGVARFLAAAGATVYECERPSRRDRRRGKSDRLDAHAAARRLIAGDGLAQPRGGGARDDLRLLLLERRSARGACTQVLNQLHAVVVTASPSLRQRLERLHGDALAQRALRLRTQVAADQATVRVLHRLARRARSLRAELATIDRELAEIVTRLAPQLLDECGVGPVCAAQLLVSAGNPTRMRTEAAFAALAGTSPVDASSGKQQRHRLNRGGDRQLNMALHLIALNRSRADTPTRRYYQRLQANGKTRREALRCVKRALARHLYHQLLTQQTPNQEATT